MYFFRVACAAVLLLGFCSHQVAAAVECLDARGNPVDWWTAIKTPSGTEYIYTDAEATTYEFQYTPGNNLAGTSGNPLAETVQQIYQQGVGYVVWNDQPPLGTKKPPGREAPHAHSKGVLGFQGDGGFYLLHSTPKYPTDLTQYKGISGCSFNKQGQQTQCGPKHGQWLYAQSYLCVSLDAENLDIVASVLRGDGLWVFGTRRAPAMGSLRNVAAFINGDSSNLPLTVKGKPFKTVGGEEFLLFGMAPTDAEHPVYLYEELIEPTLGAGLKVQTFTEVFRFDSYCPGKCEPQGPNGSLDFMTTLNVEHITVPGTALGWSTKKKACKNCPGKGQEDHSKWAVTIPDTSASVGVEVLCITDINRADHQLQRGGGAICFVGQAAPGMWQLFDSLVGDDVEQCQDVCPHDNPPHIPKQFGHASDYDDDDTRPTRKPVHHRTMKTHKAPTTAAAHGRHTKTATAAVSIDKDDL